MGWYQYLQATVATSTGLTFWVFGNGLKKGVVLRLYGSYSAIQSDLCIMNLYTTNPQHNETTFMSTPYVTKQKNGLLANFIRKGRILWRFVTRYVEVLDSVLTSRYKEDGLNISIIIRWIWYRNYHNHQECWYFNNWRRKFWTLVWF